MKVAAKMRQQACTHRPVCFDTLSNEKLADAGVDEHHLDRAPPR